MMKSLFTPWTLERYLNGAHPSIVSMLDGLMGQVHMTGSQTNIAHAREGGPDDYGGTASGDVPSPDYS